MNKSRVLITGGAGFLGSHMCHKLISDGHEVICLDNFFTGRKRNIRHLADHPRFELIRHDVIEPIRLEVDEIINMACPASPIHYQQNPVATTKTSVVGAMNMLGLAKRLNIKILHTSTSEVYGDPQVHPQPESYWGHVNPFGIRACYDEGKRCAETLFFDYQRQHGLDIKIARIFNTYGPNLHPFDGRVISNFVVQALKGDPITIYGDGHQSRSFCYVDDMIEGLVLLLRAPKTVSGPVNLGNPTELEIGDLANKIIDLCHSRSDLVFKPLPQDDPQQRCPDISQAKELLGWQPKTSLADGLQRTIDYFDGLLREDQT